jgi:hypothetical protein
MFYASQDLNEAVIKHQRGSLALFAKEVQPRTHDANKQSPRLDVSVSPIILHRLEMWLFSLAV